jgi:hypothetical protein
MLGIGHRSASDVEVTSGLSAGDQIVIRPSDKVEDGVRIAAL